MRRWIRLILKQTYDLIHAAMLVRRVLETSMRYRDALRGLNASLGQHAGRGCYICEALRSLDATLMDLSYHVTFMATRGLTQGTPLELSAAMDLLALTDAVRGVSPRGVIQFPEPDGQKRRATVRGALEQMVRGYEASLLGPTEPVDFEEAVDYYLKSWTRYTPLAQQGSLGDIRVLDEHEILALVEEHRRYNDWSTIRSFALDLFGAQVQTVVLSVGQGDEGRFPFVEDMHGYDAQGHPLLYNLAQPFFHRPLGHWTSQPFLAEINEQVGIPDGPDVSIQWELRRQQAVHDALRDNAIYRNQGVPAPASGETTCDLNSPPPITFPLVYVSLVTEQKSQEGHAPAL